MKKKLN